MTERRKLGSTSCGRFAAFALLTAACLPAIAAEKTGTVTSGGLIAKKPLIAMVTADERGAVGYAVGYPMDGYDKARVDSLAGCGQASCKIVLYAQTFCVAYADARRSDGAYWYWVANGGERDEVRSKVMSWCRDNGDAKAAGCNLQFAVCQQ